VLSEAFLADFCEVWAKHGRAALEKVATKNPCDFVRAAVALVPKKIEGESNAIYVIRDTPLTVEEWEAEYCRPATQAFAPAAPQAAGKH
jgi:hypothetical protein